MDQPEKPTSKVGLSVTFGARIIFIIFRKMKLTTHFAERIV